MNSIDAILCIAVIHHLSTDERRLQAIPEIISVLQIGGQALIYVWAKEQNKDSIKSTYLKFNKTCKNKENLKLDNKDMEICVIDDKVCLPIHENRTEFKHSDILVPWKLKYGRQFMRYYHYITSTKCMAICGQ